MAVWGMPFEDQLFEDGYARDFEQLHPGISIKYGRYEDVTEKYYTWHLLKRGADVMRVPITDYQENFTLPLSVAALSSGLYVQSWPVQMAAATIITVPTIVVFMIFQRVFVQGLA